jgi:hypothetical protein
VDHFLVLHKKGVLQYHRAYSLMKKLADDQGLTAIDFKPLICAGTDIRTDSAVNFRFLFCWMLLVACI